VNADRLSGLESAADLSFVTPVCCLFAFSSLVVLVFRVTMISTLLFPSFCNVQLQTRVTKLVSAWLWAWKQDAQLSQRDRAARSVSFGQKWKTGTGKQYLRTL